MYYTGTMQISPYFPLLYLAAFSGSPADEPSGSVRNQSLAHSLSGPRLANAWRRPNRVMDQGIHLHPLANRRHMTEKFNGRFQED